MFVCSIRVIPPEQTALAGFRRKSHLAAVRLALGHSRHVPALGAALAAMRVAGRCRTE